MRVLKDGLIYGASGALVALSYVITTPIFTRILDPQDFALFSIYITIGGLLLILSDAQIISGLSREYYVELKGKNLDTLFGSAFRLELYIGVIVSLLIVFIWLFTPDLTKFLGFNVSISFLMPVLVGVWSRQISQIYLLKLRFEQKAKVYLLLNILQIVVSTTLAIFLLVYFSLGIEGVLWGIALGQSLVAILGVKEFFQQLSKYQSLIAKKILYYAIPILPAVLAGWGLSQFTILLMPSLLTTTDLASYMVALRCAMVMSLVTQAFRLTWDPIASKWFTEKNSEEKFAKIFSIVISIGIIFIGFIVLASPVLLWILAPDSYEKSWLLVLLLSIGFLWEVIAHVGCSGNAWKRKTYRNSVSTGVGMLVAIVFAYNYTESLGSYAFAIATTIGMCTKAMFGMYLGNRIHKINFNTGGIILVLCITVLSYLLAFDYIGGNNNILITWWSTAIGLLLIIVGIISSALLFKKNGFNI